MKRSIYSGLVVGMLGLGLAAADVKISDNLSLKGFLDMSTGIGIPDSGDMTAYASFDQFEVDFMYKYGEHVSAEADIAMGGLQGGGGPQGGAAGSVDFESGWVTYTDGAMSISSGRFLSVSGWEAAEPTGLFQYSASDALVYGTYQNGVNVNYNGGSYNVYASVVSSVFSGGFETDMTRFGGELQLALMPIKEITIKVTELAEQKVGYLKDVVNAWGSYTAGPLVAAVEGDYLMNNKAEDDNGYAGLVMANYKLTPKIAATARFSMINTEGGPPATVTKAEEVTVSPSYYLADNWWVLAEVRYELESKMTTANIETTFTF